MSETGDRIIDAKMRLLSDRPFEEVTLPAIAREAGVSLAELAANFPTRGHILDAFARRIDQAVLARDFSDMADQPARERLFDVLMTRLDALGPHRDALRTLMRAVRRDPALALGLNAIAVRSAAWMMAAAGLAPVGQRGRLLTQGLAISFARVLRTFVEEDDPGLPRTMAALDKELRRNEERYQRFARVFGDAVRETTAPAEEPVPDAEVVTGEDEQADEDAGHAAPPPPSGPSQPPAPAPPPEGGPVAPAPAPADAAPEPPAPSDGPQPTGEPGTDGGTGTGEVPGDENRDTPRGGASPDDTTTP